MHFNKILLIVTLLAVSVALTGGILTPAQTEEPVDLQKGLVAYWSFDEGEGDIVFDESGNHNDGVLKCAGEECSPPKWVKGKSGYTLEFDGVDDYVEVPDDTSLDNIHKLTIAAWIKFDNISVDQYIIYKRHSASPWYSYRMEFVGNSLAFAVCNTSSVCEFASSGMTPSVNTWHYIVGTYDGNEVQIYVDGSAADPTPPSLTGSVFEGDSIVALGGKFQGRYLSGIIDEVRIYSSALTVEEVSSLFQL